MGRRRAVGPALKESITPKDTEQLHHLNNGEI